MRARGGPLVCVSMHARVLSLAAAGVALFVVWFSLGVCAVAVGGSPLGANQSPRQHVPVRCCLFLWGPAPWVSGACVALGGLRAVGAGVAHLSLVGNAVHTPSL